MALRVRVPCTRFLSARQCSSPVKSGLLDSRHAKNCSADISPSNAPGPWIPRLLPPAQITRSKDAPARSRIGQAHLWLVYRFFIIRDNSVSICHIDVRDFARARRLFWLERATLGLALL